MKSLAVRLSLLVVVLFFVVFAAPSIASAQDEKVRPVPESPPSEPPRNDPPPSPPAPPAEAPRNDPPPSPPAESPRNDSPPPRTESPRPDPPPRPEPPRSDPAPNPPSPRAEAPRPDPPSTPEPPRSEPPPNPPSGTGGGNSNNRSVNINPPAGNNQGGAGVRGTMSGDGSGNRRDRVIETESGEILPARTGSRTPVNVIPGGTSGGNRGGGNSGGTPDGRRDRDRDRDGGRWRDRHRDGRGHRHYRGDLCYQVPYYDDTVSYSASSYPDYDPDDSLSAYDRGYKDGVYTGANDGRRGQTYDPERSHFYKSGTDGYRSSKGSRDVYRQAYRDGFLRGYREGYENWQKYFVGGVFRR